MTKKHFRALARVLAAHRDEVTPELLRDLCELCGRANRRFDRDRFLEACGESVAEKTWTFCGADER